MPIFDVLAPISSAPANRLTLQLSWARPGAAGTERTATPAFSPAICSCLCFDGNEE